MTHRRQRSSCSLKNTASESRAKKSREAMEQSMDSVRLFGKTIPIVVADDEGGWHQKPLDRDLAKEEEEQDSTGSGASGSGKPSVETDELASASAAPEGQGTPPTGGTSESEREKSKEDSQEKDPKKPPKNFPCPRCSSDDTKFCYFNNYNVNQPRHFCRNCQRYWTAGGSMRNVPVGAGRRKNKSAAAAQYRPTPTQPTAAGTVPLVLPDRTTGALLSFGSDVAGLSCKRIGDDHEHSNGSSVTNSAGEENGTQKLQGWIYRWNPSPPSGHPNPLCPAASAPWGFAAQGAWSMPWRLPAPLDPARTNPSPAPAAPNTPALGKHPRDGKVIKHGTKRNRDVEDKCFRISKTTRIYDPSDAADSSVWLAMGAENSKSSEFGGGVLFKALESEEEASSGFLNRNPAALSRSLTFWESA